MLRLDPAFPALWRTPDLMQFGVSATVSLTAPSTWQERMVAELERGLTDAAWTPLACAFGASEDEAAALLEELRPVLQHDADRSTTNALLAVPAGFPDSDATTFAETLVGAGIPTRIERDPDAATLSGTGSMVIALSQHIVDPLVAMHLLRDDVPHLPVIFVGTRAEVGPLVRPGETPCAMCAQTRAHASDTHWPSLAAQLARRRGPASGYRIVAEAALTAARMLSGPATDAYRVLLEAGEHRPSIAACSPHPRCPCRSLAGIETAGAPAAPSRVPTTWRASARRA